MSILGVVGNTGYWASALFQYDSASGNTASVGLHLQDGDEFEFGITDGQAFFTGSGGGLGPTLADGETHLLVAHIREPGDGNNELVDLWVNPADLAVDMAGDPLEAATHTGNSGGGNNFVFNAGSPLSQVDLNADFATDIFGFFDEVRVGNSFADVVPFSTVAIPEPSSIALWTLLGLMGIGFGWRRVSRK